jgi:hypothetical protein
MKYRLIGIYELFIGIFGVLLLLLNLGRLFEDRSVSIPFFLGITLYIGLAAAGYLLMKQENQGIKYSVWVQILQSISITYAGKQYLFTASAYLAVVIQKNIQLKAQIQPVNFNISEVSSLFPFELRIYIIPLLIIILLLTGRK